jgi:hypothetical protein
MISWVNFSPFKHYLIEICECAKYADLASQKIFQIKKKDSLLKTQFITSSAKIINYISYVYFFSSKKI